MYIKKETSVLAMINQSLYIYKNKNYIMSINKGSIADISFHNNASCLIRIKKENRIPKKCFILLYYIKHMFLCQVLEKKKA